MSDQIPPSPLAPTVSPLLEADPRSINELITERIDNIFNRPPLQVTDADLTVMVEYYRKDRERFQRESELKAQQPPRKRGAVPKSVAEAIAKVSGTDLL